MTFAFNINSVAQTHVGMVRDSNQDSFVLDPETGLFLVADGMGGRAGGEVASALACKTIHSEIKSALNVLEKGTESEVRSLLSRVINSACLKIYERSLELPSLKGMGTTATLLWISPHSNRGLVAHVGDSRCYLLRKKFLFRITEDHSLVNEQVKVGVLKKNDPIISQMRNVITRCVGYQEEEEIDTSVVSFEEGDVFLLCSDGLSNKVTDVEISNYMEQKDISHSALRLVDISNARGGEDNCTVLIIKILGQK
jgi:PPM family protein phosphatase